MAAYMIGKMGEDMKEVAIEGEQVSLDTALEGVETDGFEVTVNGQEPEDDQMVKDGDKVVLVPLVEGGL